jgi:hypothetical protein
MVNHISRVHLQPMFAWYSLQAVTHDTSGRSLRWQITSAAASNYSQSPVSSFVPPVMLYKPFGGSMQTVTIHVIGVLF